MACNGIHLSAAMLALMFLISSNDVQISRAQEIKAITSLEDTSQIIGAEKMWENVEKVESEFAHGRVDLEFNRDYSVTGPNNRHTPNPPAKD